MPPGTSRLRIVIDASTDQGRAEIKQLVNDIKGTGAATTELTATQNKLALALSETQQAARRLAEAQRLLSMTTDPDDQAAMTQEVLKAQVALDREAAEVDQLTRELDQLNPNLDETRQKQYGLQDAVAAGKLSFTELASVIGLAQQALQLLQQGYDISISKTIAYAKETRDLARTIGATPEEASKLIQVADDVLISYETLTSAFEAGIRKGVAPTVEGLADISKEFLDLPPGIQRSAFAMEKFGRSGNDLQPLLELGPDKIREMGEAAAETGQVMSGEAVAAAREYELAVDDLTDSWEGFIYTQSNKAIPVLTRLLKEYNTGTEYIRLLDQALAANIITSQEHAIITSQVADGVITMEQVIASLVPQLESYAHNQASVNRETTIAANFIRDRAEPTAVDYATALSDVAHGYAEMGAAANDAGPTIVDLNNELAQAAEDLQLLHDAMEGAVGEELRVYEETQADLEDQIADTRAELEKYQRLHGQVARSTVDGAEAQRELTISLDAQDKAARRLSEAQQALAGNTDPGKQLELEAAVARAEGALIRAQDEVGEWNGKLAESGGTYVTDYSGKLGELQTKLDELNGQYDANAAAHEEATRRILFGIVEQQIAQENLRNGVQGYTAEQVTFLQDLALEWGLTDNATYEATQNIIQWVGQAASTGNWDILLRAVQGYDQAIRNVPQEWITTFVQQYRSVYLDEAPRGPADTSGDFFDAPGYEPGTGIGGATGLSMDVPPGYPNDSFGPIWAQSGEHVEITPSGRPAGGEIYYITVDARGSIDPEAVERAGYRAAQRAIEEAKHDSRVTIRTGMG